MAFKHRPQSSRQRLHLLLLSSSRLTRGSMGEAGHQAAPQKPLGILVSSTRMTVEVEARAVRLVADMTSPWNCRSYQAGAPAASQAASTCRSLSSMPVTLPGGMAWRSEERRLGKECVSTCRYRRSAYN